SEEATTINAPVMITRRAVSLDRIGRHGSRLARALHRLENILLLPARRPLALEGRLLWHGPLRCGERDLRLRAGNLAGKRAAHLAQPQATGALTVPGGRGVGGVRGAAAKLLAVGPELRRASEPLRVDKERELDLLVLPLAEVYELRVLA